MKSKIHIKPSHEGKFRKSTKTKAGHNVSAAAIAKGKNSSNPKTRKQATFAANAKKWHHK